VPAFPGLRHPRRDRRAAARRAGLHPAGLDV
ncbi:MAG: hypothetical protein AVDCRST_MAG27-1141, partial [uncultured Craurococcus sp.]